ncbi:hypothetical protein ACGFX4_17290 [Kitasatospora sp. NPDC048365]|uniref:hypothetical protein n=1 Tax=Kitasatospora sp. NPDC048365 TaxID=3364050 RepID=UPI0037120497
MWKVTLIVGVGIGYVLGAKAGRHRYEQIANAARQITENPKVQDAAGKAKQQAGAVAGRAAGAVADKVGDRLPNSVTDRVPYFAHRQSENDDWGTVRP